MIYTTLMHRQRSRRGLLPFWNAWVYVFKIIWSNTFLPMVFVNVDVILALLLDLSMVVSTLGFSCQTYVDVVMRCTTGVLHVDSSASPFWVNDLKCVASPYAMTLDLMTPGIFMQKSAVHIQSMLQGSCSSSGSVVTLLMYPWGLCGTHLWTSFESFRDSVNVVFT
jgi:hypothetical protein